MLISELAERFKLIGQKTPQSSAKHSGATGSTVAPYNDEPKLLFIHPKVHELGFFVFSKAIYLMHSKQVKRKSNSIPEYV